MEYFPSIQYVAAQWRSQKFFVQIRRNTRKFHKKISIHVDGQRHFLCEQKTMKKDVWKMLERIFLYKGNLEKDNGHSLVLVLRKSGILWKRTVHKESGTKLQKRCWNWLSPIFLRSKKRGKLSIHYAADQETIETIFRIFVSANQLSLYGAVAEMCRVWYISRENAATRCGGTIKLLTRAQCDQHRSSFG